MAFMQSNGPSNTIRIALCSMFGVAFITVSILYLSTKSGPVPLRAIEALENLGMGLTSLGSVAAVAKGSRDAAKDIAESMKHRARSTAVPDAGPAAQEPVRADPVPTATRTTDDVPLPEE